MCKSTTAKQCSYCEYPSARTTEDGRGLCLLHDAGQHQINQIRVARGYMFDFMGQKGIETANVMALIDQILLICEQIDG